MNIEKTLNFINLWHDINNFYSFQDLLNLFKKYSYSNFKILFANKTDIYQFTFILKSNKVDNSLSINIVCNGLLSFVTKNSLDYEVYIYQKEYKEENFKENFLLDFQQSSRGYEFTRFCLGNDMYNIILNTIN